MSHSAGDAPPENPAEKASHNRDPKIPSPRNVHVTENQSPRCTRLSSASITHRGSGSRKQGGGDEPERAEDGTCEGWARGRGAGVLSGARARARARAGGGRVGLAVAGREGRAQLAALV
jgi:hypothetical protein